MFCSFLQLVLSHKALVSRVTERCTSIASDHEDWISKSKDGEPVGIQPALAIEASAMHYTHTVGNYQKPKAA